MTSWSGFPPLTAKVPVDEKWSFVGKKEKNGDPGKPADDRRGIAGTTSPSTPTAVWCWRWPSARGRRRWRVRFWRG
jgi:hypothetical protein